MLEKNTGEGEIDLSMNCNFTKNDTPLHFFSAFYQFKILEWFLYNGNISNTFIFQKKLLILAFSLIFLIMRKMARVASV